MEISAPGTTGTRLVLGLPERAVDGSGLSVSDDADVLDFGTPAATLEDRFTQLCERFDQLEFVIVEQFEPGMTGDDGHDQGNLRERLDRIEALLEATHDRQNRPDDGLAAQIALLADTLARIEKAATAAPDLGPLHQGFARIGTALNAGLHRVAEDGAAMSARIDRIETALAALTEAAPPSQGRVETESLDTALRLLADRVAALAEAAAAPRMSSDATVEALAERLTAAEARLSETRAGIAEAGRADALRALQTTVAEILAENRRLSRN